MLRSADSTWAAVLKARSLAALDGIMLRTCQATRARSEILFSALYYQSHDASVEPVIISPSLSLTFSAGGF